jgi:hypothetical protein
MENSPCSSRSIRTSTNIPSLERYPLFIRLVNRLVLCHSDGSGDSYSSMGFNVHDPPHPSNILPLGNPASQGQSVRPNWVIRLQSSKILIRRLITLSASIISRSYWDMISLFGEIRFRVWSNK